METKVIFDIGEILEHTPAYYAGHKLTEYAIIKLGKFRQNFRDYVICALFDLESDNKQIIIADDETEVIVCKIAGV